MDKINMNEEQLNAKIYLNEHNIEKIISEMLNELLIKKPKKPFEFMSEFFKKKSKENEKNNS
jgi:hypothetical protein